MVAKGDPPSGGAEEEGKFGEEQALTMVAFLSLIHI